MSNNLVESLVVFLALALWTVTVLFTWQLLYHSHAPKIKFSNSIHQSKDGEFGSRYTIIFQNIGKRPIFNGEFKASLFTKETNCTNTAWQEIPIPVNQPGELIAKFSRIESIEDNQNCEEQRIALEIGWLKRIDLPVEGVQNPVFLEDILTSEAYIKAFFTGYDLVTGSKKTFTSKKYKIHDIS